MEEEREPAPGAQHPLLRELADLRTAVAEVGGAPLFGLAPVAVADAVTAVLALTAQVQALMLRLVAQADRAGAGQALGATSTAAWARAALGVPPREAGRLVQLARAVDGQRSATGDALAAGRIGLGQAHAVVAVVQDLPAEVGGVVQERAETWLLERAATGFDAAELARMGRAVLQVVDPDGADRRDGDALERAERRAHARRYLALQPDAEDGSTIVRGRLDTDCASRLAAVLDPLAAPRPSAEDGPDTRSHGERCHDALSEACRRLLAAGDALPSSGGDAATMLVTVPVRTLTEGVGAGTLVHSGEAVSAGTLRRWACSAGLLPVVLDGGSVPLDVGRRQRFFSGGLHKALVVRDGGCAFPACGRPPAWCDAHHVQGFVRGGGPTSLANGVLLCGHHHRLVHAGDWSVEMGPDGHPWFRPPPWIDPSRRPRRSRRAPPVPAQPETPDAA